MRKELKIATPCAFCNVQEVITALSATHIPTVLELERLKENLVKTLRTAEHRKTGDT